MKNYYNLDGIKTELTKMIREKESLLEAWKNVTFPTKKDGSPFAVMGKNINGAKYYMEDYSMQPGEYKLKVVTFCNHNGYIYDSIDCYNLVKNLKDETMIEKTQNYMPKQTYLEQVYKYDLEDIKKAVNNRINYLLDRIESLNNQLEIVDTCYNEFKTMYGKALEALETNCMNGGNVGFSGNRNDIYYMILETVKNKYPYC